MGGPGYTPTEAMTVAAARLLRNGAVCFVGPGLPSAAAYLARLTHAPDAVLVCESGAVGVRPLGLATGDDDPASAADAVVPTAEVFRYWLQGGRVDLGFLGAAQVDRFGNTNTTAIGGSYERPALRLPGAGSAPEVAAMAREVVIVARQDPRAFVERLDFVTAAGHLDGGDARRRAGLPGRGPAAVVTDIGVLTPDPASGELTLTALHPGVTVEQARAATGWDLEVAGEVAETAPPEPRELAVLRVLLRRGLGG